MLFISRLSTQAASAFRIPRFTLGSARVGARAVSTTPGGSRGALWPDRFIPLVIRKVTEVSHNTKEFEVALPNPEDTTGLVTSSFLLVYGSHFGRFFFLVLIVCVWNVQIKSGNNDSRPYTPVSPSSVRGSFRLLIKKYEGGIVSSYMHSLRAGDMLWVKGPIAKLRYITNMRKRIGMIAGGTGIFRYTPILAVFAVFTICAFSGITPMLQVIHEILNNPADSTEISLIFANNHEKDILLKPELDSLMSTHKQLTVTYVLSGPSPEWKGHTGHINLDLISRMLPPPSATVDNDIPVIYVCGPPGMMEAISGPKAADKSQGELSGLLKNIGYTGCRS